MNQCSNCGKDVDRKKDKRTINIFCNQSCAALYNNQHYERPRMTVQGNCIDCGTLIRKKYKRCPDCKKIHMYSNSAFNYTIGQIRELYKEKNALNLAAKLRSYSRLIYENSNKPKYCINCLYDKHYEVCHIKSVSSFEDTATMREVHALDNLIALCPNCHWEFDHGILAGELIKERNYL